MLGQKRYVSESNLKGRSDQDELSNRLIFERNNAVINFKSLCLIVPLLSSELQSKKHISLRRVPSECGDFFPARARVKLKEKRLVVRLNRPQSNPSGFRLYDFCDQEPL